MKEFSYEFDKNEKLGENFFIYETSHKSCICTCGYYNDELPEKIKECPNCKTEAIINICCSNPISYSCDRSYLDYLKFDNNSFSLLCKKVSINLCLNTVVKNNMPAYKIIKDSLSLETREWVDLEFYYTLNKKNKYTVKTKYFINGEKEKFLSSNSISLYGTLFADDEVSHNLKKINIEKYSSLDIWKVYSYYKNAPDLIRNGYVNFAGSVSEIRDFNDLFTRKEIKPIFADMIEQFRHVTNNKRGSIDHYSFQNIYGIKESIYCPAYYDNDFVRYVLSIDNDILKRAYSETRYIATLLRVLHKLNFNTEETNNFLELASRQKASLYDLCDDKIIEIIKLFEKYGIKTDKNFKDIRIFIAKIKLLMQFDTYSYYNVPENISGTYLYKKKMRFEEKVEKIIKFLTENKYDFYPTIINLAIEKSERSGLDFAVLHKNNKEIENCLLVINSSNEIIKILFADIIYDTKEEIDEFLAKIEEQEELSCAI